MVRFILAFVICLIFPTIATAKPTHHHHRCASKLTTYAPLTLYDLIEQTCPANCVDSEELKQITTEVSNAEHIDPLVIISIIAIESSFNIKARNGVNVGLDQVNLAYHRREFAGTNVYDVRENVTIGAHIYGQCFLKHHGNRNSALRCYNGYGGGDRNYLLKFNKVYADVSLLMDLRATD